MSRLEFIISANDSDIDCSVTVAIFVRNASSPEISARLSEEGAELIAGSPEAFDAYLKSETAKWGKVIKAAGIQPN